MESGRDQSRLKSELDVVLMKSSSWVGLIKPNAIGEGNIWQPRFWQSWNLTIPLLAATTIWMNR